MHEQMALTRKYYKGRGGTGRGGGGASHFGRFAEQGREGRNIDRYMRDIQNLKTETRRSLKKGT